MNKFLLKIFTIAIISSNVIADTDYMSPIVYIMNVGNGSGSGFIIDDHGDIITANHVVEGSSQVIVNSKYLGNVLATDKANDIALVHIYTSTPKYLQFEDKENQPYVVLGFPASTDNAIVYGWTGRKNKQFISVYGKTCHGHSGAPIIDKNNGYVMGFIDAGYVNYLEPNAQCASFGEGINSETIMKFLIVNKDKLRG